MAAPQGANRARAPGCARGQERVWKQSFFLRPTTTWTSSIAAHRQIVHRRSDPRSLSLPTGPSGVLDFRHRGACAARPLRHWRDATRQPHCNPRLLAPGQARARWDVDVERSNGPLARGHHFHVCSPGSSVTRWRNRETIRSRSKSENANQTPPRSIATAVSLRNYRHDIIAHHQTGALRYTMHYLWPRPRAMLDELASSPSPPNRATAAFRTRVVPTSGPRPGRASPVARGLYGGVSARDHGDGIRGPARRGGRPALSLPRPPDVRASQSPPQPHPRAHTPRGRTSKQNHTRPPPPIPFQAAPEASHAVEGHPAGGQDLRSRGTCPCFPCLPRAWLLVSRPRVQKTLIRTRTTGWRGDHQHRLVCGSDYARSRDSSSWRGGPGVVSGALLSKSSSLTRYFGQRARGAGRFLESSRLRRRLPVCHERGSRRSDPAVRRLSPSRHVPPDK